MKLGEIIDVNVLHRLVKEVTVSHQVSKQFVTRHLTRTAAPGLRHGILAITVHVLRRNLEEVE